MDLYLWYLTELQALEADERRSNRASAETAGEHWKPASVATGPVREPEGPSAERQGQGIAVVPAIPAQAVGKPGRRNPKQAGGRKAGTGRKGHERSGNGRGGQDSA